MDSVFSRGFLVVNMLLEYIVYFSLILPLCVELFAAITSSTYPIGRSGGQRCPAIVYDTFLPLSPQCRCYQPQRVSKDIWGVV